MSSETFLRLGTRGSPLARAQSGWAADRLIALHPGLRVEVVVVTTSGDRITDKSLADAGGKGLFTKELELALLAGEIDLAVHSLKDVPVTMPLVDQSDLTIAAIPQREDVRDVLVSRLGRSLADLPAGSSVGTGSLRRRCQILAVRPDLSVQPLRGNIDTRLRKLEKGEYGAMVMAMAGLKRLGIFEASLMTAIDANIVLPAAGQGALGLQCRRGDARTIDILAKLDDAATRDAVSAERAVVKGLNGDCDSPIAAMAEIGGGRLALFARYGLPDGGVKSARVMGPRANWQETASQACRILLGMGR